MCYAIPGKVLSIQGNRAVVGYFSETREAVVDLLDEVRVGEYVYCQGGIAIDRVSEAEAREVLSMWQELFVNMQRTDAGLDRPVPAQEGLDPLLQGVLQGAAVSDELAVQLLELTDEKSLVALRREANRRRRRDHGNASCVHGIIEISNNCSEACWYCGIRGPRQMERYRMDFAEIVQQARNAVETYGFKAIVIQCGEDGAITTEELVRLVAAIRQLRVLVFLSIGLRDLATYQRLYEAGARAVLMRFETADAELFRTLRPGTTLAERLACIRGLKAMGYLVATGFLFGLPGESKAQIIENIRLARELQPEMYSCGPFIPTAHTPLAVSPAVDPALVLKVIALIRLMDPQANILVTTAMATVAEELVRQALLAGANSLMVNLTPVENRRRYAIYDGRADVELSLDSQVQKAVALLTKLGRSPIDVRRAGERR